jgi:hypothetical protein
VINERNQNHRPRGKKTSDKHIENPNLFSFEEMHVDETHEKTKGDTGLDLD